MKKLFTLILALLFILTACTPVAVEQAPAPESTPEPTGEATGGIPSGDQVSYHWWVRMNDGSWAHKPGSNVCEHIQGTNIAYDLDLPWMGDAATFLNPTETTFYNGKAHFFVLKKANYGNSNTFTS